MHRFRLSSSRFVTLVLVVVGLIAVNRSARAQNIVINGNFSAGPAGFSTDYTFVAASGSITTDPGDCAVISNPDTSFPNNQDGSYGDHTTGSGFMLYGDGSGSSSDRIWYETLTLAANMTYNVSFWGADANAPVPNDPAVLQFFVGGDQVGSSLNLSETAGQWLQMSGSFNSGAGGTVTVSINDANTAFAYNDFTIDDISVSGASSVAAPEPQSLLLCGAFIVAALPIGKWRRN